MNRISVDRISYSILHLFFMVRETKVIIANGTGFIYRNGSTYYLITNWHNVTGKDPFTKQYLKCNGAAPDILITRFRDKKNPSILFEEQINLLIDDIPIWLEHPVYKDNVDVVAIPLCEDIVDKYMLDAINDNDFNNDIKSEITDDVFIIGFPFEEKQILGLPIWKRGSIASDPDVDQKKLPLLYIDTATRAGLSGSPVVYQRIGIHNLENGLLSDNTIFGRIRGLLGVYSGRIGKGEELAQLGLVWKVDVIGQIING